MWIGIALIVVAFWFFRSPLCGACAEALRRRAGSQGGAEPALVEGLNRVTDELTTLREQFAELAERVDFAERALVDVRRRETLRPPPA